MKELINEITRSNEQHKIWIMTEKRIRQVCYLADWKHVLKTGEQISSYAWSLTLEGVDAPWFEEDLLSIAKGSSETDENPLASSEIESINHVMEVSRKLSPKDLTVLVNSTRPVFMAQRYDDLDLRASAIEYKGNGESIEP